VLPCQSRWRVTGDPAFKHYSVLRQPVELSHTCPGEHGMIMQECEALDEGNEFVMVCQLLLLWAAA
jgi:hypothetical protein